MPRQLDCRRHYHESRTIPEWSRFSLYLNNVWEHREEGDTVATRTEGVGLADFELAVPVGGVPCTIGNRVLNGEHAAVGGVDAHVGLAILTCCAILVGHGASLSLHMGEVGDASESDASESDDEGDDAGRNFVHGYSLHPNVVCCKLRHRIRPRCEQQTKTLCLGIDAIDNILTVVNHEV